MTRKIVAIGGGESGRIKSNGTKTPYETGAIDAEIVKLTGRATPHLLVLAHAQPLANQAGYFDCVAPNYKKLGCECKYLPSDKLTDAKYVAELLDWADIIYEGGGDTMTMMKMWRDTGFDKKLVAAWENGKVMCGLSAGANCWFKMCSTDSLKILYGDDQPLVGMECLGLVPGLFVPHCNESGRLESVKNILKDAPDTIGIAMSNCMAIEIIDDKYRLIAGDGAARNLTPYGKKLYWAGGKYIEQTIPHTADMRPLTELYTVSEPENILACSPDLSR